MRVFTKYPCQLFFLTNEHSLEQKNDLPVSLHIKQHLIASRVSLSLAFSGFIRVSPAYFQWLSFLGKG